MLNATLLSAHMVQGVRRCSRVAPLYLVRYHCGTTHSGLLQLFFWRQPWYASSWGIQHGGPVQLHCALLCGYWWAMTRALPFVFAYSNPSVCDHVHLFNVLCGYVVFKYPSVMNGIEIDMLLSFMRIKWLLGVRELGCWG